MADFCGLPHERAPYDLTLGDAMVDFNLVCEAGTSLSSPGSFQITTPGTVSFRAGEQVFLGNGFQVSVGGTFTIVLAAPD